MQIDGTCAPAMRVAILSLDESAVKSVPVSSGTVSNTLMILLTDLATRSQVAVL